MNRVVDYRTDLYAMGVTFYELLTGQLPFGSADALALVCASACHKPHIPPNEISPIVPPGLSALVMKLLSKNATDRYQSAHARGNRSADSFARLAW